MRCGHFTFSRVGMRPSFFTKLQHSYSRAQLWRPFNDAVASGGRVRQSVSARFIRGNQKCFVVRGFVPASHYNLLNRVWFYAIGQQFTYPADFMSARLRRGVVDVSFPPTVDIDRMTNVSNLFRRTRID